MKFTTCLKLFALIISFASCTGPKKQKRSEIIDDSLKTAIKKAAILKTKDSLAQEVHDSIVRSKYLYLKNDSICVATDNKVYRIPRDPIHDYKHTIDYKHAIDAIYEISGDSVKRSYNLVWEGKVYFTTYEDVAFSYRRGFLYVFDPKTKLLTKDLEFQDNYLFSGVAIFIIDRAANKIFSVDKPRWNEKKGIKGIVWLTETYMYSIQESHFKFHKTIYDLGEKWYSDTSLVEFYHHSLANNGKHGKTLPKNWWK